MKKKTSGPLPDRVYELITEIYLLVKVRHKKTK